MSSTRKRLIVILIVVLSIMVIDFISGPKYVIYKFCNAVRTINSEDMNECLGIENEITDKEELITYGEMEKYLREYLKKLKYTVNIRNINTDKAKATVEFEYFNISGLLVDATREYMAEGLSLVFSGQSDVEMGELLEEKIREKLENGKPEICKATIDIECVKQGNKWVIQGLDDDKHTLVNIMTSGMYDAIAGNTK